MRRITIFSCLHVSSNSPQTLKRLPAPLLAPAMRPKGFWVPLIVLSWQLQQAYCGSTAPSDLTGAPAVDSLTQGLLADLAETRQSIYGFWQRNGPDERFGGFHGTLDRSGSPVAPTYKGIVQQARHVWGFSTFHLHGYHSSADADSSSASSRQAAVLRQPRHRHLQQQQQHQVKLLNSQQMAQTAFDFILQHMYDPSTGMFHWHVLQGGQLLQDNKVIYGQWFVLYSFSQYFTAFKDRTARDLALQCFRAMDTAWHNAGLGGFDELPDNSIPAAPSAAAVALALKETVAVKAAAAAASTDSATRSNSSSRSSANLVSVYLNTGRAFARALPAASSSQQLKGQPTEAAAAARGRVEAGLQQVRTLNVAMHGLEALTALHKVTKDRVVLQRIKEHLNILCTRLERVEGLIYEDYIPETDATKLWKPAPGSVVSYGHNLESTWLVADTLDYLQSISAISRTLARQYRDTVMSIGAAAVRDGFDRRYGGIYETGLPVTGPTSTLKVWWVQAESMLALWKLHQHYGRGHGQLEATAAGAVDAGGAGGDRQYLRALATTASFTLQHLTDTAGGGEQFWQVETNGTWRPTGNVERDTKGNRWKASYHNSRSVLFLEEWIRSGQSG